MKYQQLFIYYLLSFLACAFGDFYLQSPRGCNDRLNEASARQNENRLFNSQNNNNGGYCWGPPLYFYEGSHLAIEWTNQHSCGVQNAQCNIILQYSCSDDSTNGDQSLVMRDGDATVANNVGTIPASDAGDTTSTGNYNYINPLSGNYFYGMHESFYYYQACRTRQRNMGLFTADQNLNNGAGAMATRQSAGGTQYGFECAEERDYYPYWHPSPWKDIAILTTQTSNCGYYKSQSQNVMSKNYCSGTPTQMAANNQGSCNQAGGQWLTQKSWGIDAPYCGAAPYGRDNHLGNGINGHTQSYNWTIPRKSKEPCIKNSCSCVLRARYNISTSETINWGTNMADWKSSGQKSPIKTNPYVNIIDGKGNSQNVSLALNTAQYGRTFQDRSFIWRIKSRPKGVLSTANIWNLNVRGKRGNIVQTYPATEYDFVPTQLSVAVGDYVHFQWTGCDTNNAGNAGEGLDQSDRSNIVQIRDRSYNYPLMDSDFKKFGVTPMFDNAATRFHMALIDQTGCLSYEDLMKNNNNNQNAVNTDPQNCAKLNAAPTPYFDGGLVRVNKTGTFFYMSSRNNNFTNRTQKATLIVNPLLPAYGVALVVIGGVAAVSAGAAAGAVIYSKRNPHSRVAGFVGKMPLLNRI